jgi:chromosome segregation ATPase
MSEEITQNLPQDNLGLILVRLDSIESRLDNIETRLSNIESRLSELEEKVDRRLQETRPIWEQVLAKLDNLESEMRAGFSRIEGQVLTLAMDVLDVRTDQRNLKNRMDELEPKTT